MTLQTLLQTLDRFWAEQGCVLLPPYDVEMSAGGVRPEVFFRLLGPEPWRAAGVQPVRRPTEGRYGQNPCRLQRHFQYQVVLKPAPDNGQEAYLASLDCVGIHCREHDVRFVSHEWESPPFGAAGVGWQVQLDGMEIAQFTYVQQMGGIALQPVGVEITYGLERLALCLQEASSVWDLEWAPGIRYAEITWHAEAAWCQYHFEAASPDRLRAWLSSFEEEARWALDQDLIMPAYDYLLKCSHVLNLLESRGALNAEERADVFARVGELARRCAECYLVEREKRGFPLSPHV